MKYIVGVREIHAIDIEVEAESGDETREMVNEIIEAGEMPDGSELPAPEYSDKLDPKDWPLASENGTPIKG